MALTVDIKIKDRFFDRPAVIKAAKRGTIKVLRKAGGSVRKWAINSLSRKPYGDISSPGSTPYDHVGFARAKEKRRKKKAGQKVKPASIGQKGLKAILFGMADDNASAIIGPVKLNSKGTNVPAALERGEPSRNAKGEPVRIKARPFMQPALAEVARDLPGMFKDSIRK